MQKLLISLIVSLCILSGCGQTNYSSFKTKLGFSIDYPSYWSAGPETANGVSFVDKDTKTIVVASKQAIIDDKSDIEIINWYQKNENVTDSGDIAMNGITGKFVIYESKLGNMNFVHKDAWKKQGNTIYTIACNIRGEQNVQILPICDHMINSFSIE